MKKEYLNLQTVIRKPIMVRPDNAYRKQSKPQGYSSLNTTTHQTCNPLIQSSFQRFV